MGDLRDLTIRRLETHAEYEACVRLQEETWGERFREGVPASMLHIANEIGGVVAGAFDARGTLVAFVFGLTGLRDGRLVHWSDMLAVRRTLRDRGLGLRLKEFQRELVRPLGVEAILWTFDPLMARNARLNLVRLGARVERYVENMYGANTGSPLHDAIGTDRLVVAWDVEPNTVHPRTPHPKEVIKIQIPSDVHALFAAHPEEAIAWRHRTREAFTSHLRDGWHVAAFVGDRHTQHPCYLLAPPPRDS